MKNTSNQQVNGKNKRKNGNQTFKATHPKVHKGPRKRGRNKEACQNEIAGDKK
jgi:hypothetical protein